MRRQGSPAGVGKLLHAGHQGKVQEEEASCAGEDRAAAQGGEQGPAGAPAQGWRWPAPPPPGPQPAAGAAQRPRAALQQAQGQAGAEGGGQEVRRAATQGGGSRLGARGWATLLRPLAFVAKNRACCAPSNCQQHVGRRREAAERRAHRPCLLHPTAPPIRHHDRRSPCCCAATHTARWARLGRARTEPATKACVCSAAATIVLLGAAAGPGSRELGRWWRGPACHAVCCEDEPPHCCRWAPGQAHDGRIGRHGTRERGCSERRSPGRLLWVPRRSVPRQPALAALHPLLAAEPTARKIDHR